MSLGYVASPKKVENIKNKIESLLRNRIARIGLNYPRGGRCKSLTLSNLVEIRKYQKLIQASINKVTVENKNLNRNSRKNSIFLESFNNNPLHHKKYNVF